MKKAVFIFGGIAGAIMMIMMFITMPMGENGNMEGGELIGYTTMVVALSLIFFGVKNYRDKQQDGYIKFGKAFVLGLYITLVASAMYALGWEIYLKSHGMTAMEYIGQYYKGQADQAIKEGASAAEVEQISSQGGEAWSWYGNFVLRFLWTMMGEMFPVGLLVSLIVAAILKKKKPQSSIA